MYLDFSGIHNVFDLLIVYFPPFPLDEEICSKLFKLEKLIGIIATLVTDVHP